MSSPREFAVNELFDVVQIGYGRVGQMNGALLGQRDIRLAVFEKWPSIYSLPRAGHIDHEIMRCLQSVGCADRVNEAAFCMDKYVWRNHLGATLIEFDWG